MRQEKEPISSLKYAGIFLYADDPTVLAQWFSQKLNLSFHTEADTKVIDVPGSLIYAAKAPAKLAFQQAPEGYYTGLAHIAFDSTCLPDSIRLCGQNGLQLAKGPEISHNPGMDFINPICPFGFGLEISQDMSAPASPMCAPTAGLNHIGIPVADIKASLHWYEALGFSVRASHEIHREEDGAVIFCSMVTNGDVVLELFEFAHMGHEPWKDQPLASLLFTTENLDFWQKKAEQEKWEAARPKDRLLLKAPGGETITLLPARPIEP